jgi:hypothetical protein
VKEREASKNVAPRLISGTVCLGHTLQYGQMRYGLINSSPHSYMQKQPQTIEKNMGASDYAKRCSSRVNLDLKGENLMNVAQIKDEIRKLTRTDKIEICRWIDREVTDDISRIGMARSIQIRQEFEQICKTKTGPERRVHRVAAGVVAAIAAAKNEIGRVV